MQRDMVEFQCIGEMRGAAFRQRMIRPRDYDEVVAPVREGGQPARIHIGGADPYIGSALLDTAHDPGTGSFLQVKPQQIVGLEKAA